MKLTKEKLEYLNIAKQVLSIESNTISSLSNMLDENFISAIDYIVKCRGRVIITGMGKSGIICKKIAATLTSTGTPSAFLHPSEAMHGDLGLIKNRDIVIAVSNSGETREIIELIPHLKLMKSKIISITSNPKSKLAMESDIVLAYSIRQEGCPLDLAPMASTTTVLALGDAIAAALMRAKNFKKEDFYLFHPKGRLGQILLNVSDLMARNNLPIIKRETLMRDVITKMVTTNYGGVFISGSKGHMRGIITDGDVKRLIENNSDFLNRMAKDVMNQNYSWIFEDSLAREALLIMEE
ncbi:KpsF/GutQ family sugar-phosphate isomerase, partial [bacterium]|nr:KpsF/GutQ family sugar-phosphate isomerase [bacterium]